MKAILASILYCQQCRAPLSELALDCDTVLHPSNSCEFAGKTFGRKIVDLEEAPAYVWNSSGDGLDG